MGSEMLRAMPRVAESVARIADFLCKRRSFDIFAWSRNLALWVGLRPLGPSTAAETYLSGYTSSRRTNLGSWSGRSSEGAAGTCTVLI